MVVHMSQILCCPVAWILKLRSIHCLLETRPLQWVVWYFTYFAFILYNTMAIMDP